MAEREQRVTPLELFFDLVFVYAITQVTLLMSDDPTWHGIGRGLLILAALWWAWTGYAWLTNTLEPEEGLVRAGMFAAMAALFVVALAVPRAFDDDAVLFGVAYLIVRLLLLLLFAIAGKRDPDLLGAVLRMLPAATLAPAIIVVAGFFEGDAQVALWIVALAVDYLGFLIGRGEGARVSPAHFAERHGLIVIIALGESIVALGIGAAGVSLTPSIVASAVLGILVVATLWWAYFDIYAVGAQHRLSETSGAARVRLARDYYSYLHLPMIAGVVLFAMGVKKTIAAGRRAAGHRPRGGALRRAVALLPHPRRPSHPSRAHRPAHDDRQAGPDRPGQAGHRDRHARAHTGRRRSLGAHVTGAGDPRVLRPDRVRRHPLPRGPLPGASIAALVRRTPRAGCGETWCCRDSVSPWST